MPAGTGGSSTRKLSLLAGQAFCLGLTIAWIAIPASAIFIEVYGSGLLPLTYIGTAIAGAVTSATLSVALRRRPLVTVAVRLLVALAVGLVVSWLLLWGLNAQWVSFALLVLVPLVVPVGFMVVVAQAGKLLDVRALKANYGRVIAGFAFGFMSGGLLGPSLLSAVGRTENILVAAALAATMFTLLVWVTRRGFPAELLVVEGTDAGIERPTLRSLLRHRYVVLIIGFQMLSAVESQLLDFLMFDRAGQRYTDTAELAVFVSRFIAIAYGIDIIVLLLVAGVLMSRFGLRYGLTANPAGVLFMLGAMVAAASLQGSGATVVFVIVVAARVTDLVAGDSAARTSLSAAYQAVSTPVRLAAQATVEGLAVPVAIGVSGLALIILRSTVGTDGLVLPVVTGIVVMVWIVVAVLLYRDYRVNLLANLRHRTLDLSDLAIEGPSTLAAIDRLIDSDDPRDVRLGINTLAAAEHPDLANRLRRLALDERIGVRSDALDRLVDLDPSFAAAAARIGLEHRSPDVRAASVRTLSAVADQTDLATFATCLSDADADVRVAAAMALSRNDRESAHAQVVREIESLARSAAPGDLVLAARMLGGCGSGTLVDRSSLGAMLTASDHDVVNAALAAIRWPDDRALLGDTVLLLNARSTSGAALEALVRVGEDALPVIDDGLGVSSHVGQHGQEQLARACRMIGGVGAAAVLRRHVRHRDREVGLAVMRALAVLDSSEVEVAHIGVSRRGRHSFGPNDDSVVHEDLEHATSALRALHSIENVPSADLLRLALADEIELLQRRVLAGLSIHYGAEALSRIEFQLAGHDTRSHSLALEWLDVTLVGADKAAGVLLDPGLASHDRLHRLMKWFPAAESKVPPTPQATLLELAEDVDGRWRRPWIAACVLSAAAEMPDLGLEAVASRLPAESVSGDRVNTGIVTETLEAIRIRQTIRHA